MADALTQIAEGEGQRVIDMINAAPPGAIQLELKQRYLLYYFRKA